MLPENTIESASMNVSTNLLQSSDMISILSLRLAQRYASRGQLAILNLPKIEQKGSVGMFWRKNETPSLALSRFCIFSGFNAADRGHCPMFLLSIPTMLRIHDVIGSTF